MRVLFPFRAVLALAAMTVVSSGNLARAANQTATLSPIVVGANLPFTMEIQEPLPFPNATPPTLHSFVKAKYFDPNVGHSQWVVMAGMTNGLHDLGGFGFEPASHNKSIYVIDPVTQQVWGRSMEEPGSGLTQQQIESLATTNAQATQKGSHLYITGGYGPVVDPVFGSFEYQTFDKLTAVNLPGIIDWVKSGTGSAAGNIRQIANPIFQVTGGEMSTTSNGKTHLVFGQNYETSYEPRQNGIYTHQVRTFEIVDDGVNLSIANAVYGPTHPDFRRRDLNVVPIIRNENGQLVEKLQALSGVFTQSFGIWTVPVTIDDNGNATQPDPNAPGTFKQGMNGYRSGSIGLYSASSDTMHTLLLGGISYQFQDPNDGQIYEDIQIPFISSCTDIVTDAQGNMTQYLLPSGFPDIVSPNTQAPFLLGTQTDFFLKDGIATLGNGVIDLDAITGPTLIGWLYGGIAAEEPNHGKTYGSNAVFPVVISPQVVPEPSTAVVLPGMIFLFRRRSARRGDFHAVTQRGGHDLGQVNCSGRRAGGV